MFGYTCTNSNDYKDKFKRAKIRKAPSQRLDLQMRQLRDLGFLRYLRVYEGPEHRFASVLGKSLVLPK